MTEVEKSLGAHRIGKFTFEVRGPNVPVRPTSDERDDAANERWQRRSDALAAWLMAEWEREQRQRAAERN